MDLDVFLSANIVNKSSHGLQHKRYSDKKIYIGYLSIYIALLMQDKGQNNFPLKLEFVFNSHDVDCLCNKLWFHFNSLFIYKFLKSSVKYPPCQTVQS